MRVRGWLSIGLALVLVGSTGCAKLNEWLEGTVGEEEATEGPTPQEALQTAKDDLAGTDAAKRKAAVGALVALKDKKEVPEVGDEALTIVVGLLGDNDQAVKSEVLNQLQTLTGFPEKTEDERQLDPEGYDLQLKIKEMVLTQGLEGIASALKTEDKGIRYGALIVLYNLSRPPVVPDSALQQLKDRVAADTRSVALDETAPIDCRMLAVDTLVSIGAGPEVASLTPLLAATSDDLRGRVALAMGQAADSLADAKAEVVGQLQDLAGNAAQPESVRWRAMASLGRLGAASAAPLQEPFTFDLGDVDPDTLTDTEKISPLEAYRGHARRTSVPEALQRPRRSTSRRPRSPPRRRKNCRGAEEGLPLSRRTLSVAARATGSGPRLFLGLVRGRQKRSRSRRFVAGSA